MADAPSGAEEDGSDERSTEEQKNQSYIQKMESINQSIFSFFVVSVFQEFVSRPTVPNVFLMLLLFKSPSHTSHFLIFYFFSFLLLLFCFSVCNNISLREKKEKIIIYSAVEIMKTDVMNLL